MSSSAIGRRLRSWQRVRFHGRARHSGTCSSSDIDRADEKLDSPDLAKTPEPGSQLADESLESLSWTVLRRGPSTATSSRVLMRWSTTPTNASLTSAHSARTVRAWTYESARCYVSTKVVWQPGHRGASTTVLEPAEGEVLHAMRPATGLRGATMCGVAADASRGRHGARSRRSRGVRPVRRRSTRTPST